MSNLLEKLLSQLNEAAETVEFNQVIEAINTHYDYTPVSFTNGAGDAQAINEAGTNEGSCKIFGFALLQKLNVPQTLNCFGHYYRDDVLKNPDGADHGNIRNFMHSGWAGINFEALPLKAK